MLPDIEEITVRFLVVDDSRAMQSIVRRGLQKAGYQNLEIKVANDGLEALEIIKIWRPDMVLSDWHMPNMSGMELLNTITRQMLDVKIGFVTTESSPERLQEARAAGALFIVNKPFSDEELINAVVGAVKAAEIMESTREPDGAQADNAEAGGEPQQLSLPSGDVLSDTIKALAQTDVFFEEIEPIKLDNMMMPCIIGLFDDATSRTRAVIILDLRASCILGAVISGATPQSVRASILQQTIDADALKGCGQILKNAASVVSDRSTRRSLKLRSVNVVPAVFPKLQSLYQRDEVERSDYEVGSPGYGQGFMTILST